jgi:Flp pilus assembly protein TadB
LCASVNPTLIEGMLKTVEGWLIIGAVLVLDIIGYFWIRKLITIKF